MHPATNTIAAIATPLAPAGLGIVRLSGPQAISIAAQVFTPKNSNRSLTGLAGYTAAYGHVADSEGRIDECVAMVFRAPHSYTGEDVVELSCHGGKYLLRRVLSAVLEAGAVLAGPGEFTMRAFLNGKLDLTGAESVMALIEADGRLAAKTALAAREGAVFRKLQQIKQQLLGLQAHFAAYVDYPDDDIPELDTRHLSTTLHQAAQQMQQLLETFDAGRILREGIDTVIVGSPNVGKSTLMNLLAGCERSIVTEIAGTTRDVVEETVRIGEVKLRLSDTAGIRDTADPVEQLGVQRSRKRLSEAALVLAVFDGAEPLTEEDKELLDLLEGQTTIAIINKADKPISINKEYIQDKIQHVVTMSAKTGDGLQELEQTIAALTGIMGLTGSEPVLSTERQRDCARRSLEAIQEAVEALMMGMTLDAVSVSIDGAIAAILELTGEQVSEAVVEEVFSRFCVGK